MGIEVKQAHNSPCGICFEDMRHQIGNSNQQELDIASWMKVRRSLSIYNREE